MVHKVPSKGIDGRDFRKTILHTARNRRKERVHGSRCKVGEMDHIHCFVSAPPKYSITDIVRWLKGISGRYLLMEYPGIQEKLWRGHLWNGSYYVETIGSTSEENIRKYIERQRNVQI